MPGNGCSAHDCSQLLRSADSASQLSSSGRCYISGVLFAQLLRICDKSACVNFAAVCAAFYCALVGQQRVQKRLV
jgi:hypothetical protein